MKRLIAKLARKQGRCLRLERLDIRLALLPLATRWCAVAYKEANNG